MLYGMAPLGGVLWVASTYQHALFAIDPVTNSVIARIGLPGTPYQVLAVGDQLWVALADTGSVALVAP